MKQAVLIGLALLLAAGASAQEPTEPEPSQPEAEEAPTADVEAEQQPEVAEPEPEPRWQFETNLALTSTSGNDQITVFVTDGRITHLQTQALKLDVSGRVRYGRSQGEEVAQNMQTSLTLEIGPAAAWSPFVFGSAEKDPFKKLDLRTSGGAGVRYRILQRDAAEFTVSGAALHSYENLHLTPADFPSPEQSHNARWRWVARGKASMLDEDVEAKHETFYEPVWDHGDDYLMEMENTVRFRFTDHIAFRVAHVFQRDSSPPEDVQENDHMLTVGVSYSTKF